MAAIDHEHADARDRAISEVNVLLRSYARRLKRAATEQIAADYADALVTGRPFDARSSARRGLEAAAAEYGVPQLASGE